MTKNKTSLRSQDPYLESEKLSYQNPIPSRKWIIDVLSSKGVPLSIDDLKNLLDINEHEFEGFNNRLHAMIRDNQIYINRRGIVCVADKISVVTCEIMGHKDGYGFAVPLDKKKYSNDFFISAKDMRYLMHKDIVSILPIGSTHKGKSECKIVKIIERGQKQIVARIYIESNIVIAIPEDRRINQTILLPKEDLNNIVVGEVCIINIDTYPSKIVLATGYIVEKLGNYDDPGMEVQIALRKFNLPYVFSDECLQELDSINNSIDKVIIDNRKDLRNLPFVTIDGESAKDFDDAIYVKAINNGGFKLYVAIADVSFYVKEGSNIDKEAYLRGTSVYFPRKVIPMLPEKLSNDVCSLRPNVDRLVLVCEIDFDNNGKKLKYIFYEGIINTKARLIYDKVWEDIRDEKLNYPLKTELNDAYKLFNILLEKRQERGALDFDGIETIIIFNDDNKIDKIMPFQRNDVHRLIEEFMLEANVCAAEFLKKHNKPTLYRHHDKPDQKKLETLRAQLKFLGLSLEGGDKPNPKDYAKVFKDIKDRQDKLIIQSMLLRSMQQAVYSNENSSHFGLAYDMYTHFTSPIRRYPDLIVHRCIKSILKNTNYNLKSLEKIETHCSNTERRAEEASREVEGWLKTYFMRDKIGETFSGIVSGVTAFGIFVTLEGFYIDGMIHISDLGNDYFVYHSESLSIIGEKTNIKFSIGTKLVVKVISANLDTRRIDLSLISGGIVPKKSKKRVSKNMDNKKGKRRKRDK